MSPTITYPQQTAVARRMIRDMAMEDQPLARARSAGVPSLSTAELLALVLQTPDALDLAREMLDRAGNLLELYQLDTAVLESLRGVGEARAVQIKAALELGRRSMAPVELNRWRITSPAEAAALLIPKLAPLKQEQLHVILLDTRNRVIDIVMIGQGGLNSVQVRVADVLRPAIVRHAAAIIIAHNHPSYDPSPSPEDITVTRHIIQASEQLDITVADHIIIAASGFCSLKERGLV